MAKSYNTLKLSLLFAKYLYQNRQLNLPGIGVFSIDPGVPIPEGNEKAAHDIAQHIRFAQQNVLNPDEEFVEFIRIHTGKIRPLALSDLESFLSDGKILLNIGKPFHLEGIGTLQKNRAGTYEFYPGVPLLDKLENFLEKKEPRATISRQPYEQDYNPVSRTHQSGRMIWIVFAILIGLTAIIWGGYTLYNKNTGSDGTQAITPTVEPTVPPKIDTMQSTNSDTASVSSAPVVPNAPTSVNTGDPSARPYKFIFRLASKNYVINRYNDLKPSTPNLNWDTKDSVIFRLYLSIPASPADTARIRDSLQSWYGTKRVLIEQ